MRRTLHKPLTLPLRAGHRTSATVKAYSRLLHLRTTAHEVVDRLGEAYDGIDTRGLHRTVDKAMPGLRRIHNAVHRGASGE